MVKGNTPSRAAAGAMAQHARTTLRAILLFCFGAAAAAPMGASAYSPYFAAPAAVPGTIEAERFDRGGEGVGYHDWTPANDLGQFRPDEGVDIRADPRAPGNNWIVSSIETGEWMAYTIEVTVAGEYEWGLLASTPLNGGAYHFELDGWDKTGRVTVPNTGNWDAFQWAPAPKVWLNKGWYVLKVVSDGQYFDLDLIVIRAAAAAPAPPPLQTSAVTFACAFNALPDCGFVEQAKVPGRASLTTLSRDGGTALRLHTEPGDTDVVGSGAMERDDVYLARPGTADPEVYGEGVEQWWAHSILFPDDFVVPTRQGYVLFDFHNTGGGAGQANFHVALEPSDDITTPVTQPGWLQFIGYGGVNGPSADARYGAVIGQVQKNSWYDFVYHVRWSSGPDGFFYAWVNGKLVLAHQGPTLYAGQGVYLKLADYHQPVCDWYPGCVGDQASSVIHDRIVRGTTAQAVAIGALEYE
jgi:hypothetical protein